MLLVAPKYGAQQGTSESDVKYWGKLPSCSLLISTHYSSLTRCIATLWAKYCCVSIYNLARDHIWPPLCIGRLFNCSRNGGIYVITTSLNWLGLLNFLACAEGRPSYKAGIYTCTSVLCVHNTYPRGVTSITGHICYMYMYMYMCVTGSNLVVITVSLLKIRHL